MRFKTRKIQREFAALAKQRPSMWALISWLDEVAWQEYRKDLMLTSIYRNDDPQTVHNDGRGVDCRVFVEGKHDADAELSWAQWEQLQRRANRKFVYGTTSAGRKTKCVHLLRKGQRGSTEDHAHVQVPGSMWMGQRESELA